MDSRGRLPPRGMAGPQGTGGQLSGSMMQRGMAGGAPFNAMMRPVPSGGGPNQQAYYVVGSGGQQQAVSAPVAMEHKLATAHTEMQRLSTENQRLAATLIGLRQELAAAQAEVQRMQQALANHQAEKEASVRTLMEKNAKMLEEVRATEPLAQELRAARMELQDLHSRLQDAEQARMTAMEQLQDATADFHKARQELAQIPAMRLELQQVPSLRQEIQGLRQELQQATTHLEYEKRMNAEQMENRQTLERNLDSMARENDKLRTELAAAEKARRAAAAAAAAAAAGAANNAGAAGGNQAGYVGTSGGMGGGYPNSNLSYGGMPPSSLHQQSAYGDGVGYGGVTQAAGGTGVPMGHGENGVATYGSQPPPPPPRPPPSHSIHMWGSQPAAGGGGGFADGARSGAGIPGSRGMDPSNAVRGAPGGTLVATEVNDMNSGVAGVRSSGMASAAGAPASVIGVSPSPMPAAAPTPTEEWVEHFAPDGRPFYHNPNTGVTQWEKPPPAPTPVPTAVGGQLPGGGVVGVGAGPHPHHQGVVQGQHGQSAAALEAQAQGQQMTPQHISAAAGAKGGVGAAQAYSQHHQQHSQQQMTQQQQQLSGASQQSLGQVAGSVHSQGGYEQSGAGGAGHPQQQHMSQHAQQQHPMHMQQQQRSYYAQQQQFGQQGPPQHSQQQVAEGANDVGGPHVSQQGQQAMLGAQGQHHPQHHHQQQQQPQQAQQQQAGLLQQQTQAGLQAVADGGMGVGGMVPAGPGLHSRPRVGPGAGPVVGAVAGENAVNASEVPNAVTDAGPPGANLFVYGIPEDYGDAKLSRLFSSFGSVLAARVEVDKESGRNRGFGFVSLDSAAAADRAIQGITGMVVEGGRTMKVERKRGGEADAKRVGPGPPPQQQQQQQQQQTSQAQQQASAPQQQQQQAQTQPQQQSQTQPQQAQQYGHHLGQAGHQANPHAAAGAVPGGPPASAAAAGGKHQQMPGPGPSRWRGGQRMSYAPY